MVFCFGKKRNENEKPRKMGGFPFLEKTKRKRKTTENAWFSRFSKKRKRRKMGGFPCFEKTGNGWFSVGFAQTLYAKIEV